MARARYWRALAGTVGLAGVLGFSAVGAKAQEHGDPSAGQSLALAVCANCHLVKQGQAQAPMDSVPSFDALARDPAMSEDRLSGFLNHPHPPMPNIELSRQQIADLVSYIVSRRPSSRPAR